MPSTRPYFNPHQGCIRGGSDLGCWDFSILDFRKIEIFRKRQKWTEIRDFWHFLRYLRLFHLDIDNFKASKSSFSRRIEPFLKKIVNFQNFWRLWHQNFGIFSFFLPKVGIFCKKVTPSLGRSPPLIAALTLIPDLQI